MVIKDCWELSVPVCEEAFENEYTTGIVSFRKNSKFLKRSCFQIARSFNIFPNLTDDQMLSTTSHKMARCFTIQNGAAANTRAIVDNK